MHGDVELRVAIKAEAKTLWRELEDLLDGDLMLGHEVVVQRVVEPNLNERRIWRLWGESTRWLNDRRVV